MFTLVIFLVPIETLAQTNNAVFEVKGVKVDKTAKSAAAARKRALENGEARAFSILLDKLTDYE